jgi:hypothetical protein
VSLATDEAGGLHLIASESAAATLEAAHRWATAHLSLLAAASPLIDASKPVTRDLMVDNIHRAAGLAGGAWQVHLVQGDACYPVPDPEV